VHRVLMPYSRRFGAHPASSSRSRSTTVCELDAREPTSPCGRCAQEGDLWGRNSPTSLDGVWRAAPQPPCAASLRSQGARGHRLDDMATGINARCSRPPHPLGVGPSDNSLVNQSLPKAVSACGAAMLSRHPNRAERACQPLPSSDAELWIVTIRSAAHRARARFFDVVGEASRPARLVKAPPTAAGAGGHAATGVESVMTGTRASWASALLRPARGVRPLRIPKRSGRADGRPCRVRPLP